MPNYRDKIAAIHTRLGISSSYAGQCGIPLQTDCRSLVAAGPDVFGRERQMERATFRAWRAMQEAALQESVEIVLVSAYRSPEYQEAIFRRKLESGQTLGDILQVNAAPGYSEHHTGCALDLGCPGYEHLSEVFESSPAFDWLTRNGSRFGFSMSFPRGNSYGLMYEPWHWFFSGS